MPSERRGEADNPWGYSQEDLQRYTDALVSQGFNRRDARRKAMMMLSTGGDMFDDSVLQRASERASQRATGSGKED